MRGDTYIGSSGAVLYNFIKEYYYVIILAFVALVLTVSMLVIMLYLNFRLPEHRIRGLGYLTAFIILISVWCVTDSQALQMFSGRSALVSLISFLSFMAMPPFLTLFIQEIVSRKRKVLDVLSILFAINLFVCSIIAIFNWIPLSQCLIGVHSLIVVSIFTIIKISLEEIKEFEGGPMSLVLLGLAVLSLIGSIALVSFYVNPSNDYAQLLTGGLIIFMLFLVAAAIRKGYSIGVQIMESDLYRQMAFTDSMTGLNNRNAFSVELNRDKNELNIA